MSTKKARNGADTIERRGPLWWVRVSLPLPAGETLERGKRAPSKRVPIDGSEKMTESQAKREGAKIAADVRAGRIVFDVEPRKGALPSPTTVTTVSQLGKSWTSGELLTTHGAVNGLKPMSGGYIMGTTLNKGAYKVKTRGLSGPDFGDLPASQVRHSDIAKIMAVQKGAASTRNHVHNYLARIFSLAEIPLGLRPVGTNPVLAAYRAPADEGKHFNFLYPPRRSGSARQQEDPSRAPRALPPGQLLRVAKGKRFAPSSGPASTGRLARSRCSRRRATAGSTPWTATRSRGARSSSWPTPASSLVLHAWREHLGKPPADSPVIRDLWAPDERRWENHDEAKVLRPT